MDQSTAVDRVTEPTKVVPVVEDEPTKVVPVVEDVVPEPTTTKVVPVVEDVVPEPVKEVLPDVGVEIVAPEPVKEVLPDVDVPVAKVPVKTREKAALAKAKREKELLKQKNVSPPDPDTVAVEIP